MRKMRKRAHVVWRRGEPTASLQVRGYSGVSTTPVLPEGAESRKETPVFSGFINYFALAIAAVARESKRGNDQHNPGQPLHWAREKSTDHKDCIARHLIDTDTLDRETGEYRHKAQVAWRAMADLQEAEEQRLGKPPSRASR